MSILSLEKRDRLFWLGRYSERVYTTLRFFASQFDGMIGLRPEEYHEFCMTHSIPDIYTSKEDFAKRYCFDEKDPNSVYSALIRAYDNAIELREEIGTETFSYIQLAVYEMNRAKFSEAPLIGLQKVIDNIASFWGMADDRIEDEQSRSIIKLGKRIERVDLYARLQAKPEEIKREIRRLTHRIPQTGLQYNAAGLKRLNDIAERDISDRAGILKEAEGLIDLTRLN